VRIEFDREAFYREQIAALTDGIDGSLDAADESRAFFFFLGFGGAHFFQQCAYGFIAFMDQGHV
jgi:hypothetical protein